MCLFLNVASAAPRNATHRTMYLVKMSALVNPLLKNMRKITCRDEKRNKAAKRITIRIFWNLYNI
jgi:hypothetical protein